MPATVHGLLPARPYFQDGDERHGGGNSVGIYRSTADELAAARHRNSQPVRHETLDSLRAAVRSQYWEDVGSMPYLHNLGNLNLGFNASAREFMKGEGRDSAKAETFLLGLACGGNVDACNAWLSARDKWGRQPVVLNEDVCVTLIKSFINELEEFEQSRSQEEQIIDFSTKYWFVVERAIADLFLERRPDICQKYFHHLTNASKALQDLKPLLAYVNPLFDSLKKELHARCALAERAGTSGRKLIADHLRRAIVVGLDLLIEYRERNCKPDGEFRLLTA